MVLNATFLIVIMVVIFLLFTSATIYLIVHYQHPQDKLVAWVPKIVVLIGFILVWTNVMLLPVDVANSRIDGEIPMALLWQIVYWIILCWSIVVAPFALFYYEAEDPDRTESVRYQLKEAAKFTLIVLFVFLCVSTILYLFMGIAIVPTQAIKAQMVPYDAANPVEISSCGETGEASRCFSYPTTFPLRVSVVVFAISMMVVLGWCCLLMFGGIGLSSLPMHLINDYRFRPKRITLADYERGKKHVADRCAVLLEIGAKLGGSIEKRVAGMSSKKRASAPRKNRTQRKKYNVFQQSVWLLEHDWKELEHAYKMQTLNVFLYWGKLLLGIIFGATSIGWLLQILLAVFIKATPFLDDMLVSMDNAWNFLGILAYAYLAFFLLICTLHGNFKFGLRIFFLFSIHPMRVGETMMNSFLFNVILMLFTSVAVVQLCSVAFTGYTRAVVISAAGFRAAPTASNTIFNLGVSNLRYISYFYYFSYAALIAVSLLAFTYLCIKREDRLPLNVLREIQAQDDKKSSGGCC